MIACLSTLVSGVVALEVRIAQKVIKDLNSNLEKAPSFGLVWLPTG